MVVTDCLYCQMQGGTLDFAYFTLERGDSLMSKQERQRYSHIKAVVGLKIFVCHLEKMS